MKADRQATEARNFICPKSYVTKDGREILFREDWLARKLELWKRAKGKCEHTWKVDGITFRCSAEAQIPAHVIPRKDMTQRDDRMPNLMAYCIVHDRQNEKQNWRTIRSDKKERRDASA